MSQDDILKEYLDYTLEEQGIIYDYLSANPGIELETIEIAEILERADICKTKAR